MADLFDNIILCRECGKEMQKETIVRNGVALRTAHCEKCNKREVHPLDLEKYKEFQQIRQRPFRVKLRMVGNSYAVSIPKEIIDFFEDSNKLVEEVEMKFAELDKVMISFHQRTFLKKRDLLEQQEKENKEKEQAKELKEKKKIKR